eukprot:CAMPEP_0119107980 /NCGR_PEP_ID=MMETSP1180-20130426/12764_1 /TAXON_ID=3052 ORGANISM="Chlamydomonas cf sp, Strain CCMP681" /NCGR_SAMPLE_ID=MMETSP1180 /ASSEMBLY_ACC=CAM_ASM_000741 /LENGTH=92 /DNA_ID=CAMNT_0007093535 /DNA_START=8 /DNA_END=286 /DNA_ORIENTATION=-
MGVPLVGPLVDLVPEGNVGLLIKVGLSLLGIAWWTSGPGSDECSDFKAKAEKRRAYNRHYALKGRGRRDYFRQANMDDRAELAPSRAACKKK